MCEGEAQSLATAEAITRTAMQTAMGVKDYRGAATSLLTASSIMRRTGRTQEARNALRVAADFVMRAANQPTPYVGGPWLHELWGEIDAARFTPEPRRPLNAG